MYDGCKIFPLCENFSTGRKLFPPFENYLCPTSAGRKYSYPKTISIRRKPFPPRANYFRHSKTICAGQKCFTSGEIYILWARTISALGKTISVFFSAWRKLFQPGENHFRRTKSIFVREKLFVPGEHYFYQKKTILAWRRQYFHRVKTIFFWRKLFPTG